ncbi:MAG TPA: phosphodiester glycosidase family protein, partial [Polyangiaceae bacterium]|nr:phosphodiester glycosidase family protein [Polyangiaceae bacterium]
QHDDLKARGDGIWQAVGTRDGGVPSIHRMLLHPDRERSYAELFVFALDLSQLELHAQAGSVEPRRQDDSGETPAGSRPGVVPEEARGRLVAAFNGGFKAEHGHYGMMTNGTEWLGPKKGACTFARMASGELRVATWSALANEKDMSWWRQTPACMVEDGALHAGLRTEGSKGWGATLEGDTVIRRSAVGVTADGKFLLVGISNSTTATALARGMMHAGARQVAQLDVNFSYPRFLLYRDAAATTHAMRAEGAVKGLLYSEDEYLGRASGRDFFYVTHK